MSETVQKYIRETPLYREAEALYTILRQPGTGQISDAAEVHVSPDGEHAAFSGTLFDRLQGAPPTRVCLTELASGDTRVLTFGPNVDRSPKFSPNGREIAFLSDRHEAGDFQLYLLDRHSGAVRSTPPIQGWVEYLHWSPDGRRTLLGVAGHGADVSDGQGAVTGKREAQNVPSWIPIVQTGGESNRWRSAWVYELATDCVRQVSDSSSNIWEAAWCGNGCLAAVASSGPGEGLWYCAHLRIIELQTGNSREVYTPQSQLSWPAASPSGERLAIVEAICSDRGVVAGDLRLIEVSSGKVKSVDTRGVNISCTEWRSERQLLLAGHRGFETIVGFYDVASDVFTEVWRSSHLTTGVVYATVCGFNNQPGDCVLVGESFMRAPEIAVIRQGKYESVKSFDLGYSDQVKGIEAIERVSWKASDGLEIQGWLLQPKGKEPYPLVMNLHGGPVSHWRPAWLGRRSAHILMLLNRGYAVFLPNPRGSAGSGQDFVRHVVGELGGADTYDCLSGLDYLVEQGIADSSRLGVTGGSYGGFMTSWLITQDSRFAAAVSVAPHTNFVTEHLTSNIPHFVARFLEDHYTNPGGKYFQRSPIMHARKVKTPMLNICGALDRCTPPEEALQFHNALLENDVESVLVIYPEEGHGIRKLPAVIDYAARLVGWFEEHMPAINDGQIERRNHG